jgi:hypothetical protein
MEEWKQIPGFSRYQVSSFGAIRSMNYKNSGRIVNLTPADDKGYVKTMIQGDDGKYHTSRIHRWVALTFLGPALGREINHKDGNKSNNTISNLEYCTRSENVLHAYRTGLEVAPRGEASPSAKLKESDVIEIREYARAHSGRLKNRKTLALKYGVSEACLKDIVSGRRGAWNHI